MKADFETLRLLAKQAGATHAALVEAGGLTVHDSVRQNCLVNYCGKSGRNWTCPPHTGEIEALGQRLRTFDAGVLVQNITALEDSWDFEGVRLHPRRGWPQEGPPRGP